MASLRIAHEGSDGVKLTRVILQGSTEAKGKFFCPVGVKLDGRKTHEVQCIKIEPSEEEKNGCNGHADFCRLPFDKAAFAGSHNAGTGMASRPLDCFFSNQDLSIREQLDLGIRFFDIDVIYRFSNAFAFCDLV